MFWDGAPGATSCILEAGSVAGASNLASIDTGNALTTFTVIGPPPGDYYVRVRARNACGISAASNEVVPRVCRTPVTSCPGPTL
jgi:hypothetical protein